MKLYCLSAKDGKLLWKVDVLKQHQGINPRWENASSPLIWENLVIVYGGGSGQSFLAFDKVPDLSDGKVDRNWQRMQRRLLQRSMTSNRSFSFVNQVWYL